MGVDVIGLEMGRLACAGPVSYTHLADGQIAFIINTPYGPGSRGDGYRLRTEAVRRGVTCVTALAAANAYVSALEARSFGDSLDVVAVSYTHLDVYKRQPHDRAARECQRGHVLRVDRP